MQEQQGYGVIEINIEELVGLFLHNMWIIVLCGILSAIAAFGISAFLLTPKYESTTVIYVMGRPDETRLTIDSAQVSTLLTKDYEELISSKSVLETVIASCNLDEEYEDLKKRIEVSNAPETRIMHITVKDPDPVMAQRIATTTCEVASALITKVTDVEAVNVVDPADLPDEPSEPSVLFWTVGGAFIGLFLSGFTILIRYLSNDTIRSFGDAEKFLGWNTLAMIPVMEADVEEK